MTDFLINYGIPAAITGCVVFVAGLITWANCFDRHMTRTDSDEHS